MHAVKSEGGGSRQLGAALSERKVLQELGGGCAVVFGLVFLLF